jgi:hypothetical protein
MASRMGSNGTRPEGPPRPLPDEQIADESTSALARMLVERVGLLARKEVELAREEAREELRRGVTTGAFVGASGIAFVAALSCGLTTAILALGLVLNAIWVGVTATAIFLIAALGIGLVAAGEGRTLKPERSIRQARETARLLREPVTP